jgi:hypothetical protein
VSGHYFFQFHALVEAGKIAKLQVSLFPRIRDLLLKKINNLNKNRDCPTKNGQQQQGISYLGRWACGQAGQQAGIFKIRLGLGEIEGRDRGERQRDRET